MQATWSDHQDLELQVPEGATLANVTVSAYDGFTHDEAYFELTPVDGTFRLSATDMVATLEQQDALDMTGPIALHVALDVVRDGGWPMGIAHAPVLDVMWEQEQATVLPEVIEPLPDFILRDVPSAVGAFAKVRHVNSRRVDPAFPATDIDNSDLAVDREPVVEGNLDRVRTLPTRATFVEAIGEWAGPESLDDVYDTLLLNHKAPDSEAP